MGDGKRLKELIDRKGITVRKLARETGISATTLYSIIQKDTRIRLDNGIKIAATLNVPLPSVCGEEVMLGLEVIGKGKLRYDANIIAEEYRMSRLKEACRTAILAQLDLIDGLLRAYGTLDEKRKADTIAFSISFGLLRSWLKGEDGLLNVLKGQEQKEQHYVEN